jgi:glutamine---fructose-6-phosphate transaminase (isomerizing)
MCGIVAFVPSYHEAGPPRSVQVLVDALPDVGEYQADRDAVPALIEHLEEIGKRVETAVDLFRNAWAVRLLGDPRVDTGELRTRLSALSAWALRVERQFDAEVAGVDAAAVEAIRASVRYLRDQLFAIEHDGVRVAQAAWAFTDESWTERSAVSYAAIATALDVIDRLEVRGRDSAGMSVWVELADADRAVLDRLKGLAARCDPLLRDGSVLRTQRGICFVYKRAAIIGRLGDNTAHIRAAVRDDEALHTVLGLPSAVVTVLAHTRWASVGRGHRPRTHTRSTTRSRTAQRMALSRSPCSTAMLTTTSPLANARVTSRILPASPPTPNWFRCSSRTAFERAAQRH